MKYILNIMMSLKLIFNILAVKDLKCNIREKIHLNGLYKSGDIVLGGIFEVNFKVTLPDLTFRSKPEQVACDGFDLSGFQWVQTMIFAIEEINKDPALLPNTSLGYRLYDNCVNLGVALKAATSLIAGEDDTILDYNCQGLPPVVAIVGDPGSTHSIAILSILGLFNIPLVSYYATCSCLSNKYEYPTFFRTIPSDAFQVKAIAEIIKHYGWTWVGALASDDDYGQNAIKFFKEEINTFGCIAFMEAIPKIHQKDVIQNIVKTIKQSSATIIVVFCSEVELLAVVKEVVHQNITGRQWIASEGWSTSTVLASSNYFGSFGGTLGIAIRRGEIPGLGQFLLQIQPDFNNNLFIQFWETVFGCKFQTKTNYSVANGPACTGFEIIRKTQTAFNDVSELRASYNVYKAVYTLAHALHDLASCVGGNGPFENNTCADIRSMKQWQVPYKVNFTNKLGERLAFDDNGDALAIYDIVNWQQAEDGSVKIRTIGIFDKSANAERELVLDEDNIFWNFELGNIPESYCSKSCLQGTRKAIRKGEPVCCFDCIPCADGEISNSVECVPCPSDFWSNPGKNHCIFKEIEFLSYEDAMGITLTAVSLSGFFISVGVLAVFIHYRHTPVVKTNNSELSFLLLASLSMCFLCSLCFIGQPSHISCMMMHAIFGISFVLCISCILVKTIVVIVVFKATQPGNNVIQWFGISQQRFTVFLCTFTQILICIVWLATAPPFPVKNTKYNMSKIILECNIGSVTGFSFLLGYIGLLSGICFLLAFLARNLPDSFNEARFITFSMLIFCAVWITFIPAYVSSPGKYTVAVEIFAILASSFGILFAIFTPKCYIILLKPEQNTKKALMSR
uniref:Extracellular calcium-sensing receptor-like n=1 Tax=Erpetoichthys calabaricus TaxID=27687 RepID=A0A8C4XAH0_ERPCA